MKRKQKDDADKRRLAKVTLTGRECGGMTGASDCIALDGRLQSETMALVPLPRRTRVCRRSLSWPFLTNPGGHSRERLDPPDKLDAKARCRTGSTMGSRAVGGGAMGDTGPRRDTRGLRHPPPQTSSNSVPEKS
jgi:hypothetical protein